jgi:hypothetical protein
MDKAERRQESERAVLIQVREQLDDLIEHLENDVLPPRMVAASAQHLMSSAVSALNFVLIALITARMLLASRSPLGIERR